MTHSGITLATVAQGDGIHGLGIDIGNIIEPIAEVSGARSSCGSSPAHIDWLSIASERSTHKES